MVSRHARSACLLLWYQNLSVSGRNGTLQAAWLIPCVCYIWIRKSNAITLYPWDLPLCFCSREYANSEFLVTAFTSVCSFSLYRRDIWCIVLVVKFWHRVEFDSEFGIAQLVSLVARKTSSSSTSGRDDQNLMVEDLLQNFFPRTYISSPFLPFLDNFAFGYEVVCLDD